MKKIFTLIATIFVLLSLVANGQSTYLYNTSSYYVPSNVSQNSKHVLIYSFYSNNYVQNSNFPVLSELSYKITGSATNSDISNYSLFTSNKSYLDASAIFLGTTDGINLTTTEQIISFTGLNYQLSNYAVSTNYESNYFFLTANISETAILGNTLTVTGLNAASLSFNNVYNYTSNTIGQSINITTSTGNIQSFSSSSNTVSAGQSFIQPFYGYLYASGGTVEVNSINFPIGGTFTGSDIESINFFYYNFRDYNTRFLGSISGTSISQPTLSLNLSTPLTLLTDGGFFYININFSDNAAAGNVFRITSFTGAAFNSSNTTLTGSFTSNSSFTIGIPNILISETKLGDDEISPGSSDNLIFKTRLTSNSQTGVIKGLVLTTTGSYTTSDISVFKVYILSSSNPTLSNYTPKQIITATGAGEILNFDNIRQNLNGSSNYLFVTASLKSIATLNRTVSIATTSLSSYQFSSGSITGFTTTPGVFTIKSPNISISTIAQSNQNIGIGTDENTIYTFKISTSVAPAYLKSAVFNLSGNFTSNDGNYFELYYGSSNNPSSSNYLTYVYNYSGANSTITFTGMNQKISEGSDLYFFVKFYSATTGTVGKTISIGAGTLSNLTFVSGNKTGSLNSGSTYTLVAGTLSASVEPITADFLGIGSEVNPIYKIKLNVSNAPINLASLNLSTFGSTYSSSDLEYYYSFRLYKSTNSIFGDNDDNAIVYIYGSNSTGSGENLTFNSSTDLPIGTTYLFVVTDIASTAINNKTIKIASSNATSSILYSGGIASGTLSQGSTFTIKTPNANIKSIPFTSTILNPIGDYQVFQTLEVDANVNLSISSLTYSLSGVYTSSDISNFSIYKSNSEILDFNNYISSYSVSVSNGQITSNVGEFKKGKTYLHLVAYINSNAASGASILVSTISGVNVENGTNSLNFTPVTFTVNRTIKISPFAPQSYLASTGSRNFLYGIKASSNSQSTLNTLLVSVTGSINASLLSNIAIYVNNDRDNILEASNWVGGSVNGNVISFTGMGITLNYYSDRYIYVVADIDNSVTSGSTINISPISESSFVSNNNATVLGTYSLTQNHIVSSPILTITTETLPSKNIHPDGITDYPLYRIKIDANVPANIQSIPFSITGSYTNSQVQNFTLFYGSSPNFNDVYSSITAINSTKNLSSLSGEDLTFSTSQDIVSGTSYLFLSARLLGNIANVNSTIRVEPLSIAGIQLSSGSKTGNSVQGNTFNIINSVVSISAVPVLGRVIGRNSDENLYTIKITVENSDIKMRNLSFLTKGDFTTSDFPYMYIRKNTNSAFNQFISSINSRYLSSGNSIYSINLNDEILKVGDNYLFLSSESSSTFGAKIGVESITINSANFRGLVTVTGSLSSGELITVTGTDQAIYTNNSQPISGGKINRGTEKVIYKVLSNIQNTSSYVNYLRLLVDGNFEPSDINNISIWFSKSSNFDNNAVKINTQTNVSMGSDVYLYVNSSLEIGDNYLFVTVELDENATIGQSIQLKPTNTNLSHSFYLSGTNTFSDGSTFIFGVPSNDNTFISFSFPNQIGNSTITGTEILVNLPTGTDLSSIIASFGLDSDAKAYVNNALQISGQTSNNFTLPVTYTIVSETGLSKTYTVRVSLQNVTSLHSSSPNTDIEIYPNPSESGLFNIKAIDLQSIEVFNYLGMNVLSSTNKTLLDIQNQPNGIYLVKISFNKGGTKTYKIKKG